MKIADALAAAVVTARDVKEDAVRRHKGRVDLDTTIICYRGDDPVALVSLPPHRDELLNVAHMAARGFGPDVLAVTNDSYMTAGEPEEVKDPRTGERWTRNSGQEPGSMQTYVAEFGFDGTVFEVLETHVLNRAGDTLYQAQPYEVVGRVVKWLEWEDRPNMKVVGLVPSVLKEAMEKVSMDQLLPDWAQALIAKDPERGRCELDMATMLAIETKSTVPVDVVLFARPGSPRAQALRKKLSRSQVKDPGKWN